MTNISVNIACITSSTSSKDCQGETNILELNDKCLKKLFGYLKEFEWGLLANVCKRFKQISSTLSIENFEFMDMYKARTHPPSLVESSATRLDAFNGIMQEFDAVSKGLSTTPPQGTGKNSGEDLTPARFNSFTVNNGSLTRAGPVHKHTSSLHLKKRKFQPTQYHYNRCLALTDAEISKTKFSRCNVHTLDFIRVKLDAKFWNQHFPNLKSVFFTFISVDFERLTNFFQRNRQLENVNIFLCQGFDGSILASIGKYLPNIRSIDCNLNKFSQLFDRIQIPKLDQLHRLRLGCKGIPMSSLINKLFSHDNALEEMSLNGCTLGEECGKSAFKLHKLKCLRLSDCLELSNKKVVNLLEQLNQIETFSLRDARNTIRDVHQLLRNIPYLKTLFVYIPHEDTIDIAEYKIWLTEIQQHVDSCDLTIRVTNATKYRWIENELRMLEPIGQLKISVSSTPKNIGNFVKKPLSKPVNVKSHL